MVKPKLVTETLSVNTRVSDIELANNQNFIDREYIFDRNTEMFKGESRKFFRMFKPGIKYQVEREDSMKHDFETDSYVFTSTIFVRHFEEEESDETR